MACTEKHQLLPRLFSETLLYFQNTFFYLNNEGTGESVTSIHSFSDYYLHLVTDYSLQVALKCDATHCFDFNSR